MQRRNYRLGEPLYIQRIIHQDLELIPSIASLQYAVPLPPCVFMSIHGSRLNRPYAIESASLIHSFSSIELNLAFLFLFNLLRSWQELYWDSIYFFVCLLLFWGIHLLSLYYFLTKYKVCINMTDDFFKSFQPPWCDHCRKTTQCFLMALQWWKSWSHPWSYRFILLSGIIVLLCGIKLGHSYFQIAVDVASEPYFTWAWLSCH